MRPDNTPEIRQQTAGSVAEGGKAVDAINAQPHRRLTLSENVTLTIEVLAIAGLLGVVLWGVDLWTSGG